MDSPLIAAAVLQSGRQRTRREVVVRDSWFKRLQILASQLLEWARK